VQEQARCMRSAVNGE